MKKIIILFCCCALVAACSDDKRYAPKEGRLTVFDVAAVQQATGQVDLDQSVLVSEWTQPMQNLQNKLPHIQATVTEKSIWSRRISKGDKLPNRALPTPVIVGKDMYVLDGAYTLTKVNVETGEQIWQQNLAEAKQGLSLAYADQKVFALSTDGLVMAMDEQGKQLWQKDLATATRAQLLADKKAIYLVTAQNQLIVLNAKSGQEIWRYQTTKPETWLTNMAAPAKSGHIIVAPFATGEVIAFDADSGMLLWIQMMVGDRPKDLMAVPQIVAAPVIEGNTVYLTGNANLIGAYDLKTGQTKWVLPEGATLTPVVGGNALFLLTNENRLMAVDKKSGKIFWQKEFKPQDKEMLWQGLFLLNDALVLRNAEQWVLINPKTGERIKTEKRVSATQPILVDQHLLLINDKMKATYF